MNICEYSSFLFAYRENFQRPVESLQRHRRPNFSVMDNHGFSQELILTKPKRSICGVGKYFDSAVLLFSPRYSNTNTTTDITGIEKLKHQISYLPYDAMSWAGLGNVLISKELNSLRLHVIILSNSFEIKTLPRPAQDFAS
jgi:hypothetical protein